MHPLRFDEPVNLVQQVRQALNLVNDDDAILRCQFLANTAGILTQSQINRTVEKIIDSGADEGMANQEGLACLPRPKKEIRLFLQESRQVKDPLNPWDIRGVRFH
jgi:hypothetical protein